MVTVNKQTFLILTSFTAISVLVMIGVYQGFRYAKKMNTSTRNALSSTNDNLLLSQSNTFTSNHNDTQKNYNEVHSDYNRSDVVDNTDIDSSVETTALEIKNGQKDHNSDIDAEVNKDTENTPTVSEPKVVQQEEKPLSSATPRDESSSSELNYTYHVNDDTKTQPLSKSSYKSLSDSPRSSISNSSHSSLINSPRSSLSNSLQSSLSNSPESSLSEESDYQSISNAENMLKKEDSLSTPPLVQEHKNTGLSNESQSDSTLENNEISLEDGIKNNTNEKQQKPETTVNTNPTQTLSTVINSDSLEHTNKKDILQGEERQIDMLASPYTPNLDLIQSHKEALDKGAYKNTEARICLQPKTKEISPGILDRSKPFLHNNVLSYGEKKQATPKIGNANPLKDENSNTLLEKNHNSVNPCDNNKSPTTDFKQNTPPFINKNPDYSTNVVYDSSMNNKINLNGSNPISKISSMDQVEGKNPDDINLAILKLFVIKEASKHHVDGKSTKEDDEQWDEEISKRLGKFYKKNKSPQ